MTSAVILSGGIDSICLAYMLRPEVSITFDYGQVCAESERKAASFVSSILGIANHFVEVDFSILGQGELAERPEAIGAPSPDWWPFRNQLLVTLSAMKAFSLGVEEIIFGSVSTDSQFSDGSKEFFSLISRLLAIQEGGIRIITPGIKMKSVDLVRKSKIPIEILKYAHSVTDQIAHVEHVEVAGSIMK